MKTLVILVLVACVSVALAVHARVHVPAAWERLEQKPHPAHPLSLTFAVKQQGREELDRAIRRISDPASPVYRQYMSAEEVRALTSPLPAHTNAVLEYLRAGGIDAHPHPNSPDFITAKTSVGAVSRLFNAPFFLYQHSYTGDVIARSPQPLELPEHVKDALDFWSGANTFPRRMEKPFTPRATPDATSAPYVTRIVAGDLTFSSFFMPRCQNGAYTEDASTLCSDSGVTISDARIYTVQANQPRIFQLPVKQLVCKACKDWTDSRGSMCASTVSSLGVPNTAVFCATLPQATDYVNYQEISLTQTSLFSDGSESDVGVWARPLYLGAFMTTKLLLEKYEVPPENVISTLPSNTQSVAEFLGQYYNSDDLQQFFDIMGAYPAPVELIGPNDEEDPGGEASLDIQFIMGLAQNVTTTFWSLGRLHEGQEPFLEWMLEVLASDNAPLVHSISYADDEPSLDVAYMSRVNVEFEKAGVRGISLLFASGDNGVNAADPSAGGACVGDEFVPGFPSASPYITSVGGTQFSTNQIAVCGMEVLGVPVNCNSDVGEIASSIATGSRITSGGGFSNVFEAPWYQKTEVATYLESIKSVIPGKYYNASGRGYPDVSACARNFLVVISGALDPVDGTSAATPTFAALVTLLNEQLLANGQPPLGFLNPLLYQLGRSNLPQYYNDIVMGDNSCGEDITDCCAYGFSAGLGWDAVTGLGTPRFSNLLSAVVKN